MSATFGIGFNMMQFAPLPVGDPNETPTQRTERILAAQDSRVPRDPPSAETAAVFAEYLRDPERRMGALAMRVAENPGLMPQCEMEPQAGEQPVPGGMVEALRAVVAERSARSRFIR